ncbi:efflux RND transporter periplasmic adaptor subunit [Perlabentimonas gracilis]|uniref:efflux RND transporter periplasmic adaptor subunit n=1 Tax=Perlabentimonas gracilis TaxID=2715279 RepID=UPI0014072BC6|nr:efflux RND transporter periplasmic adaptor subunit [Perlabentimonas gracilis]NHB67702.1 efflux RND transporter periplasmic adaptor subunit [Perlabentimonas gracilis]
MTNNPKKSKAARNRNIILGVVIIALLAVVIIPQLRRVAQEPDAPAQFERVNGKIFIPETSPIRESIRVGNATSKIIRREVSAPATVVAKPSMRANIFPPAGGRIVQLFVNMGQSVRTGQSLFEIYSPDIAEVQTEFISARSELTQAERQLRRVEDLHQRGIAPLREVEETRTEFEIAQSEMEGASLKMKIMGIDEDKIGKPLLVRSPINGRVVDLDVAPGEFIAEPEEPLMIIADLSKVWITASIQEKDIRFVNPGAVVNARFAAYPGELYEGTVLFVNDILDEETRTTRVVIEFDNQDLKLKPGMFASVRFLSEPTSAIVLASTAVLQRRDYNYVYVQTEPFTFEMRKVKTGELVDGKLVILDGLHEGEMIITHNAMMLP